MVVFMTQRGHVSLAGVTRKLGMAMVAAALGFLMVSLLAPRPGTTPPALSGLQQQDQGMAVVANWFDGAPIRVRIDISGLVAGQDGKGAVLLSVNADQPSAYREGDMLAQGIRLMQINHDHIVIEQDGQTEKVMFSRKSLVPQVTGFIQVR